MKNKTKYGNIIKQLFEFVKKNEPVSWTEMNKFYLLNIKGQKTYDPIWDRGGSFCHHLVSMKNKSRRNYSGKIEYIKKELGGNRGKYYAYTLQGDREVLSTFATGETAKQEKEITEIPTTCGNCERPATYSNKGETINRCDRCYDEGLGLQQKGSAKTTVNAISDDLFNFLGEIGALGGGNAKETYNDDKQKSSPIKSDLAKPNKNPDHTVWTVEVEAISKVFATEAEAQTYVDFMNKSKRDIFKVKKLDVNPARKPKQSVIPGVKPKGWKWPQSYRDDTGASYQFE